MYSLSNAIAVPAFLLPFAHLNNDWSIARTSSSSSSENRTGRQFWMCSSMEQFNFGLSRASITFGKFRLIESLLTAKRQSANELMGGRDNFGKIVWKSCRPLWPLPTIEQSPSRIWGCSALLNSSNIGETISSTANGPNYELKWKLKLFMNISSPFHEMQKMFDWPHSGQKYPDQRGKFELKWQNGKNAFR